MTAKIQAQDQLFVALDYADATAALELVDTLGSTIQCYKVGMELFYATGPSIIQELQERNKTIFLDLKLHDIPNTVAQGLKSLLRQGVQVLTIHTIGGYKMMNEAVRQVRQLAEELQLTAPKIIGITVLTSMDEAQWAQLGYTMPIAEEVIRLARLAKEAGLDGVVSSPLEAAAIRRACGDDFMIITPGIRPAGSGIDDQARIATPQMALANGASALVIGRPITKAACPKEAAHNILQEMER